MREQTKAFRFSEYGGSEVLRLEIVHLPDPGPGEIQIRHLAIGVNFIDVYHRKGVFAAPLPLPSGLGVEGVGEVVAVGEGVEGVVLGERIGYVGGPPGGYASHRNLPAARALPLAPSIDSELAAALLFKGLTAEYLIHRCVAVAPGDWVLFHAAAGGVGSIACSWLQALGANVIGTIGTAAKASSVYGCSHILDSNDKDLAAQVRAITGGKGVCVAYDGVGAATFGASLDSLMPRGTLVSFGESSGPVQPLSVAALGSRGSLFLTRPSIAHYTADRSEYIAGAERLFRALADGIVKPGSITRYPLDEAPAALTDLEARKTKGSVVLIP